MGLVISVVSKNTKVLGVILGSLLLIAAAFTGFIQVENPKIEGIWFTLTDKAAKSISLGGTIKWSFILDIAGRLMSFLILAIGGLVSLFSTWYLSEGKKNIRYYAGLAVFASSMLGLVLANDLISLFVFWEILGFSSWWLVGFYNSEYYTGKNAKELFIINRIADVGLLVAILITYSLVGDTSISTIKGFVGMVDIQHPSIFPMVMAAGSLFVLTAFGKSAQFPFSGWLVKAMAGPTPVSALMHAATMVTAGIFLLYRVRVLLPEQLLIGISVIALLTGIMSGISALKTSNFKTLLAYSTIAQLGIMIPGLLAFNGIPTFIHLYAHAFFKSGLFLLAAYLGHKAVHQLKVESSQQYQFSVLGSLSGSTINRAFLVVLFSALAAMPVSSGFISKEILIVAIEKVQDPFWQTTLLILFFTNSFLTVLYSGRAVVLLWGKASTEPETVQKSEYLPIGILAFLSICSFWWVIAGMPFGGKIFLFAWAKFEQPHFELSAILISLSVVILAGTLILIWFKGKIHQSKNEAYWYKPFFEVLSGIEQLSSKFKLGYAELLHNLIYRPVGNFFLSVGNAFSLIDVRLIDSIVNITSRFTVVFAHFISTLDKFMVDGLVNFTSYFAKFSGTVSGKYLQNNRWQIQVSWAFTMLFILFLAILLA
ncbi:MAG: NADH-quinone oxidoreductase subunit L [Flexibacteraceae bacterium]